MRRLGALSHAHAVSAAIFTALIVAVVPVAAATLDITVTVPPTTLPPITVTTIPIDTTLPTLPAVTTTTMVTVPGTTVTTVTVPTVSVPGLTVPGVTVPTLPPVPATVPGGLTPTGLVTCAHFLTQAAAQAALLADPTHLTALLDPDHDGTACPLLPSGPATVPASAGTAATATIGGAGAGGGSVVGGPAGSIASDAEASATSGVGTTSGGNDRRSRSGTTGQVDGQAASAIAPLRNGDGGSLALALEILAFVLLVGAGLATVRQWAAEHFVPAP